MRFCRSTFCHSMSMFMLPAPPPPPTPPPLRLINSHCLFTINDCKCLDPYESLTELPVSCRFVNQNEILPIHFLSYYVHVYAPPPPPPPPPLINSHCLLTINDCKRLDPSESLTELPVSCRFVKQNEPLPIYFLSYYVHVSALFFFFFFC